MAENSNKINIKSGEVVLIRKMLYAGVLLATFIVVLHAIANDFSWYWIFKWFDIPMHILGGILAGYFGILSLLLYRFYRPSPKSINSDITPAIRSSITFKQAIIASLIGVIIVGVSWEVLEYAYGLSGLSDEFRFDTIMDLINDMIGGILVALFAYHFLLKNKNK